jgi:hypothetical protein
MRRLLTSVVALAVALGVSGAASAQTTTTTSTSSTTSSPSGATKGVRGVADTTVTIGGLGDALVYGAADVGARARFQRANDAGGVRGRTIDHRGFVDDGGTADGNRAGATKLVQQDRVFAVVPAVAPDMASSDALVDAEVPYVGWALSSSFCGRALGFGITGCPLPAGATADVWPQLVAGAIPGGGTGKAVAVVTESSPSGRYQLASLRAGAESIGLRVVDGEASLGVPAAPDDDAVVGKVITSDNGGAPAAVFVVGGASSVFGMQAALARAGYEGIFTNQLEYAPDLVSSATGALVFTQTAPVESATGNPALQQLVADVHRIAPQQPVDQSVAAGYWAADLFLAALQKAGRKLTPRRLADAANRFTYRVDETVGPTTFPAAHTEPTPCGALVTSDGTAFSVKMPYSCGRVVRVR